MEEKFDQLLQRYLAQTITDEERRRLYRLFSSGLYESRTGDEIRKKLQDELGTPVSETERELIDRLYATRISDRIARKPAPRKPFQPARRWKWLAAACSAAVLAGFLWQFVFTPENRLASLAGKTTGKEAPKPLSIARFTDKQLVKLPDGSTILLNDGSELSYDPAAFGLTSRRVTLRGEAYFDIASDPAKPFHVQSGNILTTVLGTAFNIRFVPGQPEVKVTVTRGKVQVGDGQKTFDLLTADQEITVNTATRDFVKKEVRAEAATVWKKRFLILDNITMAEAAEIIEKKFGTKLRWDNERLGMCYISASFFNDEDLDHVLQVLSVVNSFSYRRAADGEIRLTGEGNCQ